MPTPIAVVFAFLAFVVIGTLLYVTWYNNRKR